MSQVGLINDDAVFVYVDVGMRDYWKNKQNEFRLVFLQLFLKVFIVSSFPLKIRITFF